MAPSENKRKREHLCRYRLLGLITPMAGWLVLWFCGQIALAATQNQRIAVFDFDKRTQFPDALGQHIEDKLVALDKNISVAHYTAEGSETRAVKILSELEPTNGQHSILKASEKILHS